MKMKTGIASAAVVLGCMAFVTVSATPFLVGVERIEKSFANTSSLGSSSASNRLLGTERIITPNGDIIPIDDYSLYVGYSKTAPCSDLAERWSVTTGTVGSHVFDITSHSMESTGITCEKQIFHVNGKAYIGPVVAYTVDEKTGEYLSMTPSEIVFDFTK